MRIITKIEQQKNNINRLSIFLDNKFAFGIDIEIYYKYSLSKGMELEDSFINEILLAEDLNKALNYAISLLLRRDHTVKEIKDKLSKKGYDTEISEKVIDKLKEYKYINDEEFTQKYINDKLKLSKYGKNKIKSNLYLKGVDKSIISQKISEIDSNLEYDRAYAIASKKLLLLANYDKIKIRTKLTSFLVNKGFDFNTTNKVIKNLLNK